MFGKEVEVNPAFYNAEAAYLYVADTGYFHLVVLSARTVYSILVDGIAIDEAHIRKNLRQKLDYIRKNPELFQ